MLLTQVFGSFYLFLEWFHLLKNFDFCGGGAKLPVGVLFRSIRSTGWLDAAQGLHVRRNQRSR